LKSSCTSKAVTRLRNVRATSLTTTAIRGFEVVSDAAMVQTAVCVRIVESYDRSAAISSGVVMHVSLGAKRTPEPDPAFDLSSIHTSAKS
jgi:hypothetical protein